MGDQEHDDVQVIKGEFVEMSLHAAARKKLTFRVGQGDALALMSDLAELGVINADLVRVVASNCDGAGLTVIAFTGTSPINRQPLVALLRAQQRQAHAPHPRAAEAGPLPVV